MKLATFNLNGIRARLPRLLEWLEREKPDIVCLQELKCADESLPIADIEGAGYGAVWHGQKGFNGVAVLAKGDTPELRRVGLPGDPDDTHSRYIDAVVQPEARQMWRRIVNQGWTDALRSFHPADEKLYTFWDYTAGCWQRDLGFRLDHLLCSPEAADRLQDAGVDKWARGQEKASDHAPTWVELS